MHTIKKIIGFIKDYISWNNIFFNKHNIQDYTYEKLLELMLLYDKYKNNQSISEHYLFKNIILLRNKQVQDIMIPRVDIVAIEENWDMDAIISLMHSSGYSRLPVYEDNLDNILGFLHIKDLIPTIKRKNTLNMKNILRQIIFISPYMKLFDLLYEMKMKRVHMAIVVDEFGGIDGLLTIEDVMEEIVGEITDEHDKIPHEMLVHVANNTIEADARVSLDEVERVIGNIFSKTEKEECNTLSGLLVFLIGYIPSKNEVIRHSSGVEFKVLSVDPLKINKVCIYGYTKS